MLHKTLLSLLAATVLLTMTEDLKAQADFGHLNYAEVIQLMPEAQAANDSLAAMQAALQAESDAMATALQTEYTALQQREQNGELSPKELQDASADLQSKQQKIQEFGLDVQNKLRAKQEELLAPVLAKMQEAVNAVAADKNLEYVFDTSSGIFVYVDAELDVLEAVKAKLGLGNP